MDWLGGGNPRRQFPRQDPRGAFEKSPLGFEGSVGILIIVMKPSAHGDKDVAQVATQGKLEMPK